MKPMSRFQPQYDYHHQDDSTRFLGEWTSLSTTNGDRPNPLVQNINQGPKKNVYQSQRYIRLWRNVCPVHKG
jgi:hypothetical protein